jgi:hypothetical protein
MAILPLITACSYGHVLSPRIQYYEKTWKQIMGYHDFILGSVKRVLLFALPTVCITRMSCLLLQGYAKELALFFEAATYGLISGIFLYALLAYTDENFKLKKVDQASYKKNLGILWTWIIPPMIGFSLILLSKTYILLALLRGRP